VSRIEKAFENKKAFIGFLTAGDPSIDKTEEFILAMARAGADIIEIGIPFSDPVADGEVIKRANIRAINAGVTTDKVLDMAKSVRKKSNVPLVLLTYINPVFVYGYDKFFSRCKLSGIDAVIIPDLPFEEKTEVLQVAQSYEVEIITMIAPTSKDRIKTLAKESTGFIYLVSSLGVTGVRSELDTDLSIAISQIRKVTGTKIAIGFGISTPQQAKKMTAIADGAIVGSAIVKIIEENGENSAQKLFEYVSEMKKAIES